MNKTTEDLINSRFNAIKEKSLLLRNAPLKDRKKKLKKLERWILQHRSEIQQAIHQDLQKPVSETDINELFVVLTEIRTAIRKLNGWAAKKPIASSLAYFGTQAYVYHEPKGACLIIAPWNYPFQLAETRGATAS